MPPASSSPPIPTCLSMKPVRFVTAGGTEDGEEDRFPANQSLDAIFVMACDNQQEIECGS